METNLKKVIAEVAGMDYRFVDSDMELRDDLGLTDSDIDDILNELEDNLDIEIEDRDVELVYVADMIALIKEYY